MGLRSEWINFDDAWLDVPATAQKGRKGEKRPLSVPLCGWALEQLLQPLPKVGYIWPNARTGDPTGNVTRTLQKVAKEAKVPEFSLHDLRATGNSWLANAKKVDQRIRQYLMGHKTGGPAISRYTKITADTEQELRDAVGVFDEIRRKNEKVSSIFQQRKRR